MNDIKGKIYSDAGVYTPRFEIHSNIEQVFKAKKQQWEQELTSNIFTTINTEQAPQMIPITPKSRN